MDKSDYATVRVGLTCDEAQMFLLLVQSNSFPHREVAATVSDKLRDALVESSFDPAVDIEIECTQTEARFVEHGRLP